MSTVGLVFDRCGCCRERLQIDAFDMFRSTARPVPQRDNYETTKLCVGHIWPEPPLMNYARKLPCPVEFTVPAPPLIWLLQS